MSASEHDRADRIGELTVKRVNGVVVVTRCDQYIWIEPDLAAEIADPKTKIFAAGHVRYQVLGPSATHPGSLICERMPPPDPVGPATLP